ncbi:hypothetical protein JCM8547_005046 [Rhodosporidiobolus lusitaniae]
MTAKAVSAHFQLPHAVRRFPLPLRFAALAGLLVVFALVALRDYRQGDVYRSSRSTVSRLRHLTGRVRHGVGASVQRVCGETDSGISDWLDALHGMALNCPQIPSSERQAIVDSATRQCGSWCVWDLRTPKMTGWHLSDDCFRRFESPHSCDEWFWQRPSVNLEPSNQQTAEVVLDESAEASSPATEAEQPGQDGLESPEVLAAQNEAAEHREVEKQAAGSAKEADVTDFGEVLDDPGELEME